MPTRPCCRPISPFLLTVRTNRVCEEQHRRRQSQTWRTSRQTGRIGRPRRRNRILEGQTRRPSHMRRRADCESRRRALQRYAKPFSLRKALLTAAGQRKASPRPARRPPPRRGSPDHRRRRWAPRCRENNPHQEPDQTVHQADALHTDRPSHSRNLETAAPHLH